MVGSIGFAAMSGYMFITLIKDQADVTTSLSTKCDFDTINGTLLAEFNSTYTMAEDVLCSENCPCNLIDLRLTTNYTNVRSGAYNVQKC